MRCGSPLTGLDQEKCQGKIDQYGGKGKDDIDTRVPNLMIGKMKKGIRIFDHPKEGDPAY